MLLTQINLVVSDLERSRVFYEALGCRLRAIELGDGGIGAWATTSGFAPVTLHSVAFAAWWDDASAGAQPGGSIVPDITFESRADAETFLTSGAGAGGVVTQDLRDMPWGEAYAVLTDPDGYRWGVKAPSVA